MKDALEQKLKGLFDFESIESIEEIQALWANYGCILRLNLVSDQYPSVILKWIKTDVHQSHPRNWNTYVGHQRKVRSYEVECNWYKESKHSDNSLFKYPKLIAIEEGEEELLLVLEDLKNESFNIHKSSVNDEELNALIKWLAYFHIYHMDKTIEGIWEQGTYWYLDTRPDEYAAMEKSDLKDKAKAIDKTLKEVKYKTILHGDAKYANFLFSDNRAVAAVDFQYVGYGCGMKDLIYLFSCDADFNEDKEDQFLTLYFQYLREANHHFDRDLDINAIEKEWGDLYAIAWADFERFLKGWSPGHWKMTAYSEKKVSKALNKLSKI